MSENRQALAGMREMDLERMIRQLPSMVSHCASNADASAATKRSESRPGPGLSSACQNDPARVARLQQCNQPHRSTQPRSSKETENRFSHGRNPCGIFLPTQPISCNHNDLPLLPPSTQSACMCTPRHELQVQQQPRLWRLRSTTANQALSRWVASLWFNIK